MTKKGNAKRALLLSALSLVLCVSMLVGSTFAWFTDSVVSGNNIIKSGNLDVEMMWADGKADPATVSWTDAAEGAIFNYTLWEPGYTEVRHIQIKNAGTLALRYQLTLVPNGEVSKLADVIDVYYLDPATQVSGRNDLDMLGYLGTLSEVMMNFETNAYGELKNQNDTHTITIALKMRETAGNEYQGLSIGSDFSVQLYATQLTHEDDSFGPDYDAGAPDYWTGAASYDWYTENPDAETFTLNSAADLAGFAAIVNGTATTGASTFAVRGSAQTLKDSFKDHTIVLGGDIDLLGKTWTPIGVASNKGFYGTFDGNGHTISNFKLTTSAGKYGAGFFGNLLNGATIKNVNFDNVSYSNRSNVVGVVAAYLYGSATFENIKVTDANVVSFGKVGGILGMAADPGAHTLTLKNCSVNGTVGGGYNVGGLVGLVLQGVTVNVENCKTDVDFVMNDGGYNFPYVEKDGGLFWNYNDEWLYAGAAELYCYYDEEENEFCMGEVKNVHLQAEGAAQLAAMTEKGMDVVLSKSIKNAPIETTAPYGNKLGIAQNGGVLDGNGNTLNFKWGSGDTYGIMTSGGTIKDLTVEGAFRGIVIMYPKQDVKIDGVVINDEDVCYAINTAEGEGEHKVIVTNSELAGWTSIGTAVKSVSFTDCQFKQGTYYTNVFGRLVKPYVDCVFENCDFSSKYYIDLSALVDGATVTLKNCTVNGVKLTAENWTSLIAPESDCGEGQISIEARNGSYMTADNVLSYVVIK